MILLFAGGAEPQRIGVGHDSVVRDGEIVGFPTFLRRRGRTGHSSVTPDRAPDGKRAAIDARAPTGREQRRTAMTGGICSAPVRRSTREQGLRTDCDATRRAR